MIHYPVIPVSSDFQEHFPHIKEEPGVHYKATIALQDSQMIFLHASGNYYRIFSLQGSFESDDHISWTVSVIPTITGKNKHMNMV